MASDDNRGKSGSRVTETSKLNPVIGKKATSIGSERVLQERKTEPYEDGWSGTPGGERSRPPSVKSDLADQIGARLRSVYDDVLVQPVPERFLELLRQLEGAPGPSFARVKKDGT